MRWKPTPSHTNMEFILCWLTIPWLRPALHCGWYTQWHSTGKKLYQLQVVASLSDVVLCTHFLSSELGFCPAWTCSILTHAATASVSSCVSQSCWIWKTLFSSAPSLIIFLLLLLHRSLKHERREEIDKDIHMWLRTPNSLTRCTLSNCESVC